MSWLVAVSCSGKEECAKKDLESQTFVCYLPRLRWRVRTNNRLTWIERSLFGRYFFVMINEEWKRIFGSPNLFGVLMNDGKPSEIGEEVIEEIKSREENGFIKAEEFFVKKFRRGQRVRVTAGSFFGMTGIFSGDYDDYGDRARVLFDMMGRKTTVVMRQDDLVLVEDKNKRKRYLHRSLTAAS